MFVAVVLVQMRVTRIGCHPTGTLLKVRISPPSIVTFRLPVVPTKTAVDAAGKSSVLLGVTATG
jgi:hypothetical protein